MNDGQSDFNDEGVVPEARIFIIVLIKERSFYG